jgi:8-amino-7-oxononanoate synthase
VKPILLSSKINRTIIHEEKEYLFFSGTAYLGMGAVDEFEELVRQGIQQYGVNHGMSRINNVRLSVYERFELFFAEHAEAEKGLVFSSGYIAGHAAVTLLKKKADRILVAPDTHPAVLPDELVPNPSFNFKDWTEQCQQVCSSLPAQKILILANAVDPLKPVIHDFDWIQELPDKHEYTLLIDDSHAFGVLGKGIFGTYSQWKNLPVNLIVSGSLGKGVGIPAGIILGNKETMHGLEQNKIFRSSSPPAPGYLSAFLSGQHIYHERQEKLTENICFFHSLIKDFIFLRGNKNYPVFTFQEIDLTEVLLEKGMIISSFSYPTPQDPAVSRIIVSAHHEKVDLVQLSSVLKEVLQKIKLGFTFRT